MHTISSDHSDNLSNPSSTLDGQPLLKFRIIVLGVASVKISILKFNSWLKEVLPTANKKQDICIDLVKGSQSSHLIMSCRQSVISCIIAGR